jgi:ATP-binding cassette, subfamily B, bacterial
MSSPELRLRLLPRFLTLAWRAAPGLLAVHVVLDAAAGLFPVVQVQLLRRLIAAAQLVVLGQSPLWAGLAWGVALAVLSVVLVAFNALHRLFVTVRLEERLRLAMEERLYSQALSMPLEELERAQWHDALTQAQQGLQQRLNPMLAFLSMGVTDLVTVVSLLAYLAGYARWLPLLVAAGTAPAVLLGTRQLRERFLVQRALTGTERRLGVFDQLLTGRPAAAEVRLFGFGPWMIEQAGRLRRTVAAERIRLEAHSSGWEIVRTIIGAFVYGVAIVLSIGLFVSGRIGVGAAAALFYAIEEFQRAFGNLIWSGSVVYADLRYVQDYFTFLAGPLVDAAAGESLSAPWQDGIAFEHVSFTYPGSDRPALHDLCFRLRPGERVALVGENGAGKSTLARLLLGLYRPTAGRILVDGVDLREIAPGDWYRRTGAVFQDFLRYETTVRENIGVGWLDQTEDQSLLVAAARSGALATAEQLPNGLETPLGRTFHDGVDLSVGQWQQLAIARAYLRPAELLVLDEPASALDAKVEAEVYAHFTRMAAGRTALLISHRLGSCRLADRILVLQDGQLVEEGTHPALLAADGRYAELYRMQAAWYR